MKRLLLLLAFYMAAAIGLSLRAEILKPSKTASTDDTITIKLPNGTGIMLSVKNSDELKSLRKYNLDSLMILLDKYVEQAEQIEKSDNDGNHKRKELTMTFYPAKDSKDPNAPEQVTLTITGLSVKNTEDKNKIRRAVNVIVDYKSEHEFDDSIKIKKREKKTEKNSRKETYIDLGVNTFLNQPNNIGNLYDLKPLGSRYVSISHLKRGRIGGKSSPFYLRGGLELAFNNFMFDRNVYLTDLNGNSTVVPEPETGRNFEKSKLTYSTINVPVDLSLQFKDKKSKDSFKLSAGGFAGYRLGAHTKLKYQEDGKTFKDKERGSFHLEDFQYGLTASIGYRDLELFGKYNLNSLFKEKRGPDMQVISFGVRI